MSLSISSIETYNLDLASELIFSDLAATFLVQVGGIDPGLQLLDLFALGADFLNFFLSAVIDNPHLGQLTSQLFFHLDHVDGAGTWLYACDAVSTAGVLGADGRVKGRLPESHTNLNLLITFNSNSIQISRSRRLPLLRTPFYWLSPRLR